MELVLYIQATNIKFLCRLILIAEKETVYSHFPTPLINRLEKHFVLMSSILEEWQMEVLDRLQNWIKAFSPIRFAEVLRITNYNNKPCFL